MVEQIASSLDNKQFSNVIRKGSMQIQCPFKASNYSLSMMAILSIPRAENSPENAVLQSPGKEHLSGALVGNLPCSFFFWTGSKSCFTHQLFILLCGCQLHFCGAIYSLPFGSPSRNTFLKIKKARLRKGLVPLPNILYFKKWAFLKFGLEIATQVKPSILPPSLLKYNFRICL